MLEHVDQSRGSRGGAALSMLAALVVTATACGHGRLVPGKEAKLAGGEASSAFAVDKGVRVVATFDDWRGLGERVPEGLTPIKVRVVNRSDRGVRILYEQFTLRARGGHVYRAAPVIPAEHDGFVEKYGPVRPVFATAKFRVAPRYHDVYPTLEPWHTPLIRDETSYDEPYERWGKTPSKEIRRMALPEGVLEPGGVVTGYLYFENPVDDESRVRFTAALPWADEGGGRKGGADVEIPLRVD